MNTDQQLEDLFAKRLVEFADSRQHVLDRYANQDWANLAPVEQTVKRLEKMQQPRAAKEYVRRTRERETAADRAPRGLVDEELRATRGADPGELVFEKIIGQSEIMPIRFVHRASRIARTVGRIVFRPQRRANGTGFLVSPRLLLTNFHVLRDHASANSCLVQFEYLAKADGSIAAPIEFALRPDLLFLQSPIADLDCTLVAVQPVNDEGVRLDTFGFCPLIGLTGKEHPGERVNVIHHPGGSPMQVSLRENFVASILADYLHYMTDTAPGSSGSPVFNDEWEVVALHHASREITDPIEINLYRDALASNPPAGTTDATAPVIVNEGARISRIVEWLTREAEGFVGEARELLEDVLLHAAEAIPDGPVLEDKPVLTAGGAVTININLAGTGGSAITTSRRTVATSAAHLELFRNSQERDVLRGLAFLQQKRESRYLPSVAVQTDRRNEYYGDLPDQVTADTLTKVELYEALNARVSEAGGLTIVGSFPQRLENLETMHRPALESGALASSAILEAVTYDRSRAHLYTWIDLHPDRMLHCIYTGALIAPEQLMLKDLITGLDLAQDLPRRFRNNQFLNCEHVVPQSWFDKEAVAKADLHHLFTADGAANNFRSDSVYRALESDIIAVKGPANRPEYIKAAGLKATGPKRFEPSRSKPVVARATLYFLLAHREKVDDSRIDQAEIDLLIKWSDQKVPGPYEIHRNETISEIQFNRNPLIDFPEWVHQIDFMRGVSVSSS